MMKQILKRFFVVMGALSLILGGFFATSTPAQAASIGNIPSPFAAGQSTCVFEGYNYGTHVDASKYGLDLVTGNCDSTSAAGLQVYAPLAGKVAYTPGVKGDLCINIASGGSYTLTHIGTSLSNGALVSAGQAVGAVGPAGSYGNNNVAHLHFQIWASPNCWNGPGVPFDTAHNTRICGAIDLPATGGSGSRGMWSGTTWTASTCASAGSYVESFQSNTGVLFYSDSSGVHSSNQGMASGTSPSIASFSSGGSVQAYQANTGNLYYYDSSGGHGLSLGMASGTSPSVATSGNGFRIAFQANTGSLYYYDSVAGVVDLQQGMAPGTSPSIARMANGVYVIVFQASNGSLYYYNSTQGVVNLQLGMAAGTSPSVAASPNGGFRIAFQANTGSLYYYDAAQGVVNLQQGMVGSPSVAALSNGGYVEAFQANTGVLFYADSSGVHSTNQGMAAGTNPSIAAGPSGSWRLAFQANTGMLFYYDSVQGFVNLQQGMAPGSSPAVTG